MGRQAGRQQRWRRGDARDVTDRPGGAVVAVPPAPTLADRLPVGEAARALDISAATVRRRIRAGELQVERVTGRGGTARVERRLAVEDEAQYMQAISPDGPRPSAPWVERVVHTPAAAADGLAVWCSLATLAQQLATANVSQARARHGLEHENARLQRENARLVAEFEATAEVLASQAEQEARAARRAGRLISGLSLVVAALGAVLLMVGPLAAVCRLGT